MSKFKGTKGKWFINDEEPLKPEDYLEIMVEVESKHFTKVALGAVYDQRDDVGKANAKLIAAAPELLEALNAITDNIETWLNTGVAADKKISKELYNNAVSAIKKATE